MTWQGDYTRSREREAKRAERQIVFCVKSVDVSGRYCQTMEALFMFHNNNNNNCNVQGNFAKHLKSQISHSTHPTTLFLFIYSSAHFI